MPSGPGESGGGGELNQAGAGGEGGGEPPVQPDGRVQLSTDDPEPATSGNIGPTGGVIKIEGAGELGTGFAIEVPPDAVHQDTTISVSIATIHQDTSHLPRDTQALTELFVLGTDPPVQFDRPVLVTLPYDVSHAKYNEMIMPYRVDTGAIDSRSETRIEATSTVDRDTAHGKVTFATRSLSSFLVLEWKTTAAKALSNTSARRAARRLASVATNSNDSVIDTGFSPGHDGWFIANYGSIVNPGGNCIGMSSFAKWFYTWRGIISDPVGLYQKYRLNDPDRWEDDTVAIEAASRAQLGETAIWTDSAAQMNAITMSSLETAKSFVQAMHDTGQPQILYLSQHFDDGSYGGAHAVLVTGYTGSEFTLYDPNHPGELRSVSYDFNGSWGIYNSGTTTSSSNYHYNVFGHVGPDLFHGFTDMENLYANAETGFSNGSIFPTITLTSPAPASLDANGIYEQPTSAGTTLKLTGTITGGVENPDTTLVFVNGAKFVTPIDKAHGGAFSQTIPVFCSHADDDDDPSNDKENNNVVEFLVTKADGFSQYAGWKRIEIDCTGTVPVARVTMSWDSGPTNDVDLWVTGPDNVAIGYSHKTHTGGAFLDVDDVDGYGPEHYTIPDGNSMPYGDYRVDVNYYDDDGDGPANYTVTVEVGVIKDGVPYYDTTQTVTGTLLQTDDRDNGVATFTLRDPAQVSKDLSEGAQDH